MNWCFKYEFLWTPVTADSIMGHHDLFLWPGKVDINEISWRWLSDLTRPPVSLMIHPAASHLDRSLESEFLPDVCINCLGCASESELSNNHSKHCILSFGSCMYFNYSFGFKYWHENAGVLIMKWWKEP